LILLLSSSSFFLPTYLAQQLVKRNYTQAQLSYAESLNIVNALVIKQQSAEKGSALWLNYTTKLALQQHKQALLLAHYYQQKYNEDHNERLISKILLWYKLAIKHGSTEAKFYLAQWYFQRQQLAKADNLLASISHYTSKQAILYFKVLIAQGTLNKNARLLDKLQKTLTKTTIGNSFLQQLLHYKIIIKPNAFVSEMVNALTLKASQITHAMPCDNAIQFFATRLRDLHKIETLIKSFNSHPLAEFVCFAPVRYIAITQLNCSAKEHSAIHCNEATWRTESANINSKYIGLLLPQGGANVHLGMIYIDSKDTVKVFAHEISHLLGFIDEYPLPLNHPVCKQWQQEPFAHNIVVIKKNYQGKRSEIRQQVLTQIPWAKYIKPSTPILQTTLLAGKEYWQVGTPYAFNHEVGLFLAETCQGRSISAFKPITTQTQLRYYENAFPAFYIQQLKQQPQRFLMPSFHYNLTLAP